jgi:hypothetical protein
MQKMGVAAKVAAFFSRFFYLSMLSVSGIMITCMNRRKGVKSLGEEMSRTLLHMLAGLIAVPHRNSGAGIIAGPAAEAILPASFCIHRN